MTYERLKRMITDPPFRRRNAGRLIELVRGRLRGFAGARIGCGVKLTGHGNYQLARRSALRDSARLFVGEGAVFILGEGAAIGARSVVNATTAVRIGRFTQVSWQCQILDSDFHQIVRKDGERRPVSRAITIGDHVLVGTGAMILKGVTIGDNAIVAAGSVVTRDVASDSIVAGNPARPVAEAAGWQ